MDDVKEKAVPFSQAHRDRLEKPATELEAKLRLAISEGLAQGEDSIFLTRRVMAAILPTRVATDIDGIRFEVVHLASGEDLVTLLSLTRFLDSLNDNLNLAGALLRDLRRDVSQL